MPTYKTPNVYIEEIPSLPPSVVPVATAVPAFIGYTEKAGRENEYRDRPIRISSILDYATYFGGPCPTPFTVTVDGDDRIADVRPDGSTTPTPKYLLYYALRLFFDNGGGPCYIVSIGNYSEAPSKERFEAGLAAARKEDEPTLLLLTDAVNLASSDDYYGLCQMALQQCAALKDRFAVFDVLDSDRDTNGIGAAFRNGIGTSELKYGAAYYPYLQTTLNYHYTDDAVAIEGLPGTYRTDENGLLVTYAGPSTENPKVAITLTEGAAISAIAGEDNTLTIGLGESGATVAEILAVATEVGKYRLARSGSGLANVATAVSEATFTYAATSNADLKTEKTGLYNEVLKAIDALRVTMPPSSAVAGVYAKVDLDRGVWKAPANVSLASVNAPTEKVTNEEQENLNVDPTAGKSINAIRSFTGKGTLVWGARTLAGNDNEWRYVSVRRFFNLIEESIQKATNFVVFESNTAITWLKVKTIIESYLEGLWRQGALAGATTSDAFFVKVGLGQTMTSQDILEGRMIVEIGVAAVRPAEFIVLRFSHKLNE